MGRYTFMMTHDDSTAISVTGSKECITDVIEDFKSFLLAVGYAHENVSCIQFEYENSGIYTPLKNSASSYGLCGHDVGVGNALVAQDDEDPL